MPVINIALIQMNIKKGNYEQNLERVKHLTGQINTPVDVIVLPELWSVDFDFKNMKEHGEKCSIVKEDLSSLAKSSNSVLIGGSIPETIGNKVFNASFVYDRNGQIQDKYCKMHLVSKNNLEGETFEPGSWIPLFHVDSIPFGLANCYDLRFPELFRGLALRNAKVIFVIAQYANPLYNIWITLLKARAIENQVYIVALNRVGKIYFGHSVVISPLGEVLYEAGETEGLHIVSIDTSEVDKVQEKRRDSDVMNLLAYNKYVYKNNFIGVGAIIEKGNKVLLVKQNYGKQKDMWFLPGGFLDKGEMLEQGIEREVFEETSIQAKAENILAVRALKDNDVIDCYIIFKMKYLGGTPKSDNFENTEVRFFTAEEISKNDNITLLAKEVCLKYLSSKENKLVSDGDFISNQGKCKLYI